MITEQRVISPFKFCLHHHGFNYNATLTATPTQVQGEPHTRYPKTGETRAATGRVERTRVLLYLESITTVQVLADGGADSANGELLLGRPADPLVTVTLQGPASDAHDGENLSTNGDGLQRL